MSVWHSCCSYFYSSEIAKKAKEIIDDLKILGGAVGLNSKLEGFIALSQAQDGHQLDEARIWADKIVTLYIRQVNDLLGGFWPFSGAQIEQDKFFCASKSQLIPTKKLKQDAERRMTTQLKQRSGIALLFAVIGVAYTWLGSLENDIEPDSGDLPFYGGVALTSTSVGYLLKQSMSYITRHRDEEKHRQDFFKLIPTIKICERLYRNIVTLDDFSRGGDFEMAQFSSRRELREVKTGIHDLLHAASVAGFDGSSRANLMPMRE